jgi:bleomycin hydrolase
MKGYYMKTVYFLFVPLILLNTGSSLISQDVKRDTGKMIEYKNEFYDSVTIVADSFRMDKEDPEIKFMMDFSGYEFPTNMSLYKTYWHNEPVSQAISGMCWCYCTTSYLESEVYRIHGKKLKLSELYTVYWEYVEKATRFVRERGDSEFGEGSESNAVTRNWKKYGIVPAEAYTGFKTGQIFHDHRDMFDEMDTYLKYVKEHNLWNEEVVIGTIKSILNHYIGVPPQKIKVDGKEMTPKEYLEKVVRLNLNDYIQFLSLLEKPYYQQVEFPVPDNWWHSEEYYNVPLDEFMSIIKSAVREGYAICIGGDVSEAGYDPHTEVAVVPSFDIPAGYIDEYSRQFRFSNKTTEDDHGIHLVGYYEKDGKDWYLIKDSGSGSRNGPHWGYYFYHEDYVKLKMLSLMVHKDAAEEILKKFRK